MLRFRKPDGSSYPDWGNRTISSFAKCIAGATPSTKVPEYWDNPTIRWMSSGEVHKGEVFDTEKKISQKGYDNASTKMIKENTVVIALAGQGKTRGTVAITRVPLCTNQSICAIETDDTIFDDYLYQYLKTQYVQLRQLSSGEGQRGGLNLKLVGGYEVPIPCLEEQHKIADCLSPVDAVIADYEAQVENMQNQKKGVMQKLFSQEVRFKADDGGEYPEWTKKHFVEIANVNMGQSPDSNSYNDDGEGLPLIQGNADITNHKSTPSRFTDSPTKVCETGNIIMTVRAPVGFVAFAQEKACIGRGVCAIKSKNGSNDSFLYYWLMHIEPSWKRIEQGSTFTAISGKDFQSLKIELPCLEEQQKIADCLTAFDNAIEDLQKTVEHWKNVKKGLLQQLFA